MAFYSMTRGSKHNTLRVVCEKNYEICRFHKNCIKMPAVRSPFSIENIKRQISLHIKYIM